MLSAINKALSQQIQEETRNGRLVFANQATTVNAMLDGSEGADDTLVDTGGSPACRNVSAVLPDGLLSPLTGDLTDYLENALKTGQNVSVLIPVFPFQADKHRFDGWQGILSRHTLLPRILRNPTAQSFFKQNNKLKKERKYNSLTGSSLLLSSFDGIFRYRAAHHYKDSSLPLYDSNAPRIVKEMVSDAATLFHVLVCDNPGFQSDDYAFQSRNKQTKEALHQALFAKYYTALTTAAAAESDVLLLPLLGVERYVPEQVSLDLLKKAAAQAAANGHCPQVVYGTVRPPKKRPQHRRT